ncbi:LacI family DNA-binding transcriptional regulator [Olivibacter sitiensis]|uniref:LacI family DNA-binding transcriptional regulator n=1 Tax=Olivibacter sitiensis TaxID=376470 RepID=UPI0003FBD2FA|nr:LacI family DNA-binding transcriptional regulator [Olivibacter sitiensis]
MESKKGRFTLKDIAQALGVSTSTVSKALNDSYEIGAHTKASIKEFAKQVGYSPDTIAQSLKMGKSNTIGVIVCSLDNIFMAQMLDSIQHTCHQNGYSALIMPNDESYETEKQHTDLLISRGVDGLLVSTSLATTETAHLSQLLSKNIPVVLFDRLLEDLPVCKVSTDNCKGAYMATAHLIDKGYKRIALLQYADTHLNIHKERLEGYRQALDHHHIAFHEDYVKHCRGNDKETLQDSIAAALKELMSFKTPPDAIFATTDRLTLLSLRAIRQMSLSIPQDLALIGFSNTELADDLSPSLSTIVQPAREIAATATNLLIELIKDKNSSEKTVHQTILLEPQIIARDSTKTKGL